MLLHFALEKLKENERTKKCKRSNVFSINELKKTINIKKVFEALHSAPNELFKCFIPRDLLSRLRRSIFTKEKSVKFPTFFRLY